MCDGDNLPKENGQMNDAATVRAASVGVEGPFLRQVRIRNYKSIGKCAVALGSLTLLVGRNGSGKSNFLDALRFVVDALQTSLDHAVKTRSGVDAVRRRSTGHPRNFAIELEIDLLDFKTAVYGFEIGSQPEGGFFVKHERLKVLNPRNDVISQYRLLDAKMVSASAEKMPPASRSPVFGECRRSARVPGRLRRALGNGVLQSQSGGDQGIAKPRCR